MRLIFFPLLLLCAALPLTAQQLFINAASGADTNSGTRELPLRSLSEAARRVNADKTSDTSEVIVAPGLYILSETALFQNNKPYTSTNRLIIRAATLPDDPAWHPQQMPTIVTAVPLVADDAGETGNGIRIEVNHATIQGLRFTGGLDYYYKSAKQIRRSYPLARLGSNLDDLLVKQCVFIGDEQAMPLHVGVIANGHGLVLEHDVFYNVRNAVVFWNAEGGTSHRNAMRNCIVYGATMSAIWTVQTDGDDFDFRNNVVANSQVVWMREHGGTRHYKAVASIFADNANLAAYGAGAAGSVTHRLQLSKLSGNAPRRQSGSGVGSKPTRLPANPQGFRRLRSWRRPLHNQLKHSRFNDQGLCLAPLHFDKSKTLFGTEFGSGESKDLPLLLKLRSQNSLARSLPRN